MVSPLSKMADDLVFQFGLLRCLGMFGPLELLDFRPVTFRYELVLLATRP